MVLASYNVSRFLKLSHVLKFILFHILLQVERLDESATTSSTVSISNEMLESQSKIFGLNNPSMVLTDYQKAVNQASLELCRSNIALLKKRGELLEKARKKVDDEGYNYKKKSSRSTVFGSWSSDESRSKRKYVQSDCREEEMKKISTSIQSYEETIALLQKQKLKYTNSERFLEAVEINKRIMETTEQKQIKVKEMDKLKKAIVRSNSLKKKKRLAKQRKVLSTASLKLAPLKSWLVSKESSGGDSGEDTEIIGSSDSETESDKDLPRKCLLKMPSENVVEVEGATEGKEECNQSMEVNDEKADEARCSTGTDPPLVDEAEGSHFL